MLVNECIHCPLFPCADVRHDRHYVPDADIEPAGVKTVLISECAAAETSDNYYAPGDPLFARTTLQAFQDAGVPVDSLQDILDRGVYLTTAVKCAKTGYGIARATVLTCSRLLENELALFPNVRTFLLMGDVAITALNAIARRRGEPRVIPAGATYKIRGGTFSYRGARAFPSDWQAGPSFVIEKSKRQMIAQDIAVALRHAVAPHLQD